METNLQYKNKYLKYKKKYLDLQKKMKGGAAATAKYITSTVPDEGSDCQPDIVVPPSDRNVYTIITNITFCFIL